jgi:murein biosynthesis integral membrane protein MurJ
MSAPQGIPEARWRDWTWQMQHRIRTAEELAQWIEPTADEVKAIDALAARFRFVITPYYAALMDPRDPECPIRRQVVPRMAELGDPAGLFDPLDEVAHSPVKNVVRVYRDRIAFCVNNECALYCRFCLRKRMVGDEEWSMKKRELGVALDWIRRTPEIRDVLLTGGDPLVFSDERLEWLLAELRRIPHVEILRLGTRLPVTLPYRVTEGLVRMLERHHPIWVNTHFNHPRHDAGALRGPRAHARATLLLLPGPAARGHRALPHVDRARHRDLSGPARPHQRLRHSAVRARHAVRQGPPRPSLPARSRGRRRRGRELRRAPLARAQSARLMKRAPRLTAVTVVLAGSVLLSRVLGYAREAVLARELGASAATDAYYAAFQIPDLLNYFLAGGALSIAFVPFYSKVLAREGAAAAEALLAKVTGTMGALTLAATVVLWWQADTLTALQFPHFAPETQALTVRLTRIVLPAQVFFIAGGILRAALMAHDRFATQALAPLLYNGAIIIGGLGFGASYGAEGFAWGALVGAAFGAFAVAWIDVRVGLGMRGTLLRIAPFDGHVLRYLVIATPLMLGISLTTTDEWYGRWFGGLLATGTVAHLTYARRLMQLPVAVVGQALATATLPTLARLWSEGRREALDRVMLTTLQVGLGLSVLAAAASIVLAAPIVEVVYRRGAFSQGDADAVTLLLRAFSVGVPAWVLQQIAVRAFYARNDTWRPMLLSTLMALAAIPLYVASGPRWGAVGLAWAGVIGMGANTLVTLLLARRLHGAPDLRQLAASGARATAIAALACVPAALLLRGRPGLLGALRDLGVGGAAFGAVALALVFVLGDAPLRAAMRRQVRRLAPRAPERAGPAEPPA